RRGPSTPRSPRCGAPAGTSRSRCSSRRSVRGWPASSLLTTSPTSSRGTCGSRATCPSGRLDAHGRAARGRPGAAAPAGARRGDHRAHAVAHARHARLPHPRHGPHLQARGGAARRAAARRDRGTGAGAGRRPRRGPHAGGGGGGAGHGRAGRDAGAGGQAGGRRAHRRPLPRVHVGGRDGLDAGPALPALLHALAAQGRRGRERARRGRAAEGPGRRGHHRGPRMGAGRAPAGAGVVSPDRARMGRASRALATALALAAAGAAVGAQPPGEGVPVAPAGGELAVARPPARRVLRRIVFEATVYFFRDYYWDEDRLDWDAWAERHRRDAVEAEGRGRFDAVMRRMVAEVGDDHSRWLGLAGLEPGLTPITSPFGPTGAAPEAPVPDDLAPPLAAQGEPTPSLGMLVRWVAGAGVVVERVLPGTPAEEAGVRRGDVIVAIAGRPLAEAGAAGVGLVL